MLNIGVLTSLLYFETKEVQGRDKIIFGGAERYLYELCKLLQEDGHDVTVFQSLNQNTDTGWINVNKHVAKNFRGIPVVCLSNTDRQWQMSTNPYMNMVYNEIATNMDLSIFFVTFLCYPYTPVNSISISHGVYWDSTHHFVATARPKEKEEWLRRNLVGFTEPDVCVAVDSNVRKAVAALSPGAEKRIQIIYNFVDTKKFTPKEKDWEGINVLFPRRLTAIRGCNEFIKASQQYREYRYISVGQATVDRMNESAKEYGNERGNIEFLHKEMDGMEEVYQSADIAVVPTVACEGLSLSLLEAMSCGLPVITTPVGGLGDAIIPGYNALLYDPHHGGLGELIHYMAQDEDMRKRFGERNRQIATECFDIEIWKERWRQLIKGFGD